MNTVNIPAGYSPRLNSYDTQRAIDFIKQNFKEELCRALSLGRVSAPLFVTSASGLNDNLSGVERPVSFDVPSISSNAEIVHSLAKWKRLALKTYGFSMHEGLLTDMNAIRRDETLDNLHSIYVDQWDWEKIIDDADRRTEYLHATVQDIVGAVCRVSEQLKAMFPAITATLSDKVTFITSQELEDRYPDLTPDEREYAIVKEYRTVFISQIGGKLRSGVPHSNRAPDYDDWTLNGDIFFWNDVLECPLEISSMGIRVNSTSLDRQLTLSRCDERRTLPFHSMLLHDELPLTIGGGIGQSRLCMLLIGCAHIGEVQSSLWDSATVAACKEAGIPLL